MKLLTWNKEHVLTRISTLPMCPCSDSPGHGRQAFLVLFTGIESFLCYQKSFLPHPRTIIHMRPKDGCIIGWYIARFSDVYPEGWEWGHMHVTPLWADNPGGELCESVKLLDKSGPRQNDKSDRDCPLPADLWAWDPSSSSPVCSLPQLSEFHLSSLVVLRRS